MDIRRYYPSSIIKMLIATHVAVLAFGFLGFLLFLQYSQNSQFRQAVLSAKQRVQPRLLSNQDRWRAFYMLGLRDSLREDFDKFRKENPGFDISVVRRGDATLTENDLVIPAQGSADDTVVVARVLTDELPPRNRIVSYATVIAIWLASLFLISLTLSSYLFRKHIQTPINQLRKRVFLLQTSGNFTVRDIAAKGEIRELLDLIASLYEQTKQNEKLVATGELAQQVAHDIRSPLCALTLAVSSANALPEAERRLIQSAVGRINEIANNLSNKKNPILGQSGKVELRSPQHILSLLRDVSIQKRAEFSCHSEISILESGFKEISGTFAAVAPADFKTLVSNIVNNARDAVNERGRIEISCSFSDPTFLKVCISDNGSGIDPQVIPRITERGYSHGKENGSGLGLYHAATRLKQWNGSLDIESSPGNGTRVIIGIPTVAPPIWFQPRIDISPDSKVVIVDDDPSIHELWKYRMSRLGNNSPHLLHFYSLEETRLWVNQRVEREAILFLVDHEFSRTSETGLGFIEQLGISKFSYLVTNSSNDPDLLSRCVTAAIGVIPKCEVEHISIHREPVRSLEVSA